MHLVVALLKHKMLQECLKSITHQYKSAPRGPSKAFEALWFALSFNSFSELAGQIIVESHSPAPAAACALMMMSS
jgi:hypothetical protein